MSWQTAELVGVVVVSSGVATIDEEEKKERKRKQLHTQLHALCGG